MGTAHAHKRHTQTPLFFFSWLNRRLVFRGRKLLENLHDVLPDIPIDPRSSFHVDIHGSMGLLRRYASTCTGKKRKEKKKEKKKRKEKKRKESRKKKKKEEKRAFCLPLPRRVSLYRSIAAARTDTQVDCAGGSTQYSGWLDAFYILFFLLFSFSSSPPLSLHSSLFFFSRLGILHQMWQRPSLWRTYGTLRLLATSVFYGTFPSVDANQKFTLRVT